MDDDATEISALLNMVEMHTLTFNLLLERSGIAANEVLVFRHRPYEPALNRVFDQIVSERRDLFESYQDTHGARTESALKRAKYVASFIRSRPGTAIFIGLYSVDSFRPLTEDEYLARPKHQELIALGMSGVKSIEGRDHVLEFSLGRLDWHRDWQERLIIKWPGLERSWYRWADRNEFEIEAIAAESCLNRRMPSWDEISIEWHELKLLPDGWKAALKEWRGIYLITDQADGKKYVGSAYGQENILQRWLEYARSGHGGNKHLRNREPSTFRFAILQRVSPDMDDAEVIRLERTWKVRLDTLSPDGLNES